MLFAAKVNVFDVLCSPAVVVALDPDAPTEKEFADEDEDEMTETGEIEPLAELVAAMPLPEGAEVVCSLDELEANVVLASALEVPEEEDDEIAEVETEEATTELVAEVLFENETDVACCADEAAADVEAVIPEETLKEDDEAAELVEVDPVIDFVDVVLLTTVEDLARGAEVLPADTDDDMFECVADTLLAIVNRLVVLLAARLRVLVVLTGTSEDVWLECTIVVFTDDAADALVALLCDTDAGLDAVL